MSQQNPPNLTLSISQKPGLFTKDLQILNPSTNTIVYTIQNCKSDQWTVVKLSSSPAHQNLAEHTAQIRFHGNLRATISFPTRPSIDLSLTGGFFSNGYTFPSGSSGLMGVPLTWSGGDSKRTLTTATTGGGGGEWIATYDKKVFSGSGKATLEVAGGVGSGGGGLLDEVVVTAVAVAEIVRRRKNAGN